MQEIQLLRHVLKKSQEYPYLLLVFAFLQPVVEELVDFHVVLVELELSNLVNIIQKLQNIRVLCSKLLLPHFSLLRKQRILNIIQEYLMLVHLGQKVLQLILPLIVIQLADNPVLDLVVDLVVGELDLLHFFSQLVLSMGKHL